MFVWEKIARILELSQSFDKQKNNFTCPNSGRPGGRPDKVFRNTVDPQCFELGQVEVVPLFRSQTDFPWFYRYLTSTRLFRNPTTRSFFHWFSHGTFCRIGWSCPARCKQKWKCMPPGIKPSTLDPRPSTSIQTRSLATGQSCYNMESSTETCWAYGIRSIVVPESGNVSPF